MRRVYAPVVIGLLALVVVSGCDLVADSLAHFSWAVNTEFPLQNGLKREVMSYHFNEDFSIKEGSTLKFTTKIKEPSVMGTPPTSMDINLSQFRVGTTPTGPITTLVNSVDINAPLKAHQSGRLLTSKATVQLPWLQFAPADTLSASVKANGGDIPQGSQVVESFTLKVSK